MAQTPKQRFENMDKILEKLAELDANYLLGKSGKYVYKAKREKLKQEFQNNFN